MSTPSPSRRRLVAVAASAGALVLGALVAVTAAPSAHAFDSSCSPASPQLQTLKVSPTKVNVTSGARTVTVSGTTSGPALTSVTVTGRPVSDGMARTGYARAKGRSFSVKISVPKGAAKGVHRLDVGLSSADGYRQYSYGELASMPGVASQFSVVSKPDVKAPAIKRIKLSTKKVNTTRKAAKVRITVTASDKGGSGLGYASVMLKGASKRQLYAGMSAKKGKLVGTMTVPTWMGSSKFTVVQAYVSDAAGNYRSYAPKAAPPYTSKLTKPMKASLKVTSKKDTKKPSVGAVTVSPRSISGTDRRWQVNYTVKASDAQSGVGGVQVELTHPDGWSAGWGYLTKKGSVWKGSGIIYCGNPAGTYSVVVTASDRAGNETRVTKGTVTITE